MSVPDDVISAIEEITGEPGVGAKRDLRLFDTQLLDSLRFISLLVTLNEKLGVDVGLTEVDRDSWATPAKIVSFMEQRISP